MLIIYSSFTLLSTAFDFFRAFSSPNRFKKDWNHARKRIDGRLRPYIGLTPKVPLDAFNTGCEGYIKKPLDEDKLFELLKTLGLIK